MCTHSDSDAGRYPDPDNVQPADRSPGYFGEEREPMLDLDALEERNALEAMRQEDAYPSLDSALTAGRDQDDNAVPTPTLAGYTPGVAPWLLASTVAIDRRIGARLRCPDCGCKRMQFRPHYRLLPRSYRIKAVCPCGHSEEM